jgi:hypothetical protein
VALRLEERQAVVDIAHGEHLLAKGFVGLHPLQALPESVFGRDPSSRLSASVSVSGIGCRGRVVQPTVRRVTRDPPAGGRLPAECRRHGVRDDGTASSPCGCSSRSWTPARAGAGEHVSVLEATAIAIDRLTLVPRAGHPLRRVLSSNPYLSRVSTRDAKPPQGGFCISGAVINLRLVVVRPRTRVYVDGFNFHYAAFGRGRGTHAAFRLLDLPRFFDVVLPELDVTHIRYLTAKLRPAPRKPGDRAVMRRH